MVVGMARIGYARTSTADKQIARHQIELLETAGAYPIFIDQLSGKNTARPELWRALDACNTGDALVVTRLSRLARSLEDLLAIAKGLTVRGVDLVVTQQHIDTSTPIGRLVFQIMGAVDEFQREVIVANVKDGMASAKTSGARVGGRWQLTREEHRLLLARRERGISAAGLAEMYGFSRQTVYRYLNTDPDERGPAAQVVLFQGIS